MTLEPVTTAEGRTWTLSSGDAVWHAPSGRWHRPGLGASLHVAAGEVALVPTLGDGNVVAHLADVQVVPPSASVTLMVAWPLVIQAFGDARTFDRFRLGERATLLGDPATGVVLPAAIAPRVDGPLPADRAALRIVLHNALGAAQRVRKVAFAEDALTLWSVRGALHAGTVQVHLVDEHAESTVLRPTLAEGAVVVRPGRDLSRTGILFGWADGSARAIGFTL